MAGRHRGILHTEQEDQLPRCLQDSPSQGFLYCVRLLAFLPLIQAYKRTVCSLFFCSQIVPRVAVSLISIEGDEKFATKHKVSRFQPSGIREGCRNKPCKKYGLLPNRGRGGGGVSEGSKKLNLYFGKVFFQLACRIILGPPKHVLHLV